MKYQIILKSRTAACQGIVEIDTRRKEFADFIAGKIHVEASEEAKERSRLRKSILDTAK